MIYTDEKFLVLKINRNNFSNDFKFIVDVLVRSKWRRLIRGTEEDSDDSGG